MTQAEATTEARRRWGPQGMAIYSPPIPAPGVRGRYLVGIPKDEESLEVCGIGDSWEAAFRCADRTAHTYKKS